LKKWIITGIAVVAAAVLIVVFLPKKGKVEETPPPLVEVTKVDTQTVAQTIDLVGYVTPVRQTAAVSRAYGKVLRINVKEGSMVYKDQVIMVLQPEEVGLEFQPQPVKAPISGLVAQLMVKEGEPVASATPVAAIIDPSKTEVDVPVAGEYYSSIAIDDRALIMVNSDTVTARINSKTPLVDPVTRTFSIKLTPLEESSHLVSGLSVNVRLILEEKKGVLAVPNSALDDSKLFVASGDSVVERTVVTGITGSEETEVVQGLSSGERIVTFGGQNLVSGQKIRTVEK
jgi:multidrug efflux pump subunit AcrA (membrane-fusion protein)